MVTSTMRRVKAMAFFATRLLSGEAKVGGGSYRGGYMPGWLCSRLVLV